MKDRNNKPDEIWVTLKQGGETFNRYEVSNYGRIWDISGDFEVSQVLSGKPQYLYVNIYRDCNTRKRRTQRRVNNIMGWSFLGDPPTNKHTVDHIDRDKFNNHLSNLRWADIKEQAVNRDVTILCQDGENLFSKIEDYCKESGEIYSEAYPHLANLYKTYGDFEDCVRHRRYYLKYGVGWGYEVVSKAGDKFKLVELCEEWGCDYLTTKSAILKGVTLEVALDGGQIPFKVCDYPDSIEYNNYWYPNKESLVISEGNCCVSTLNERLKQGLSLQEALTYDFKDALRFELDGFFMTKQEHCNRLCVSLQRVESYVNKHNISFEEAIKIPVQRVIKHNIDGVTKRNCEWFTTFNIEPKSANSWMSKSKERNLRSTLEYYGVDTSGMKIYPCDGDIVMYSNHI